MARDIIEVVGGKEYRARLEALMGVSEGGKDARMTRFLGRTTQLLKINGKVREHAQKNPAAFFARMDGVALLDLDFTNDIFVRSSVSKKTGQIAFSASISAAGYMKLIAREPGLAMSRPVVVVENDEFEFYRKFDSNGLRPHLHHKPNFVDGDGEVTPDNLRCVYVCWERTQENGRVVADLALISRAAIFKARSMSQRKDGPWKDFFEPMVLKTAILRAAKYMGLSEDARSAMTSEDDDSETDIPADAPPPASNNTDSDPPPDKEGDGEGHGDDGKKALPTPTGRKMRKVPPPPSEGEGNGGDNGDGEPPDEDSPF